MKNIAVIFFLLMFISCSKEKYGEVEYDLFNYHRYTDEEIVQISDSIKNLEGDTLIGNFIAGMSQQDYDKVLFKSNIYHIKICNKDFDVLEDSTKFVAGKLKAITIRSCNTSSNTTSISEGYSYGRGLYAEGRSYYNVDADKERIMEELAKKYGPSHFSCGWQFTHKHIYLGEQRDNELSDKFGGYYCYFVISFSVME